jgi:AcrR family transcriptional regulator
VGRVKGPTLREEHAAVTRRRILTAAREVFEEVGYPGARIEDVADRAGVAVPTVYKGFSNKPTLLIESLREAMAGDDVDRPVDQQEWFTEQLFEPDPTRQLELVARNSRRVCERAAYLLDVLRSASASDGTLAAAWRDVNKQRAARSRRTAKSLISKAAANVRLGQDEVAMTLLALTEPQLFLTYTGSGRTASRYEAWLSDLLCRSILETAR